MEKKCLESNYENDLQKINQTEFRLDIIIKRKGDKLYAG